MADENLYRSLVGLFIETAEAHHRATGGPNPQWADWYAHHMIDSFNALTGSEMSEEELRDWLVAADERYNSEPQEKKWPLAYGEWMAEEVEGSDA